MTFTTGRYLVARRAPEEAMGCKKGKSKIKRKPGRYTCTECGAVVKKKNDACEPKKIKKKSAHAP
jgi:hypothetical protein